MPDDKLIQLETLLNELLSSGVKITARAVTRAPGSPFKHPSDITRRPDRAALLANAQKQQATILAHLESSSHNSKSSLIQRIASLTEENARLQEERELLIASHKAVLLAVGQLGGMAAWRQFYSGWESSIERLHSIGAIPDNVELLRKLKG